MPRLLALDLDPGEAFVDAVRGVLERGEAFCVLDPRLPPPARADQLAMLRPTAVLDRSGEVTEVDRSAGVEPGDALVMATSGSSGTPKVAVLTAAALEASATATSAALGIDPQRDRWLSCLPLAHIGGLAVVLRALLTSTPLELHDHFDAELVEAASRNGATRTSLVLTALRRLDASGFTTVLLGGAAPPEQLAANVVATYGLTETGSGCIYDGRPLDGVEVRAVDGELYLRGPMLLRCYRDGRDPFVDGPEGRRWFPTGDAGAVYGDGRVEVFGRLGDVINTGGEKVHPIDVERVLATTPGVTEVAVWKRPDPTWGERVVAFVVPSDPAAPPQLADLLASAESLAPWQRPKELVLVEALPRAASGKVVRRLLS